MNPLLALPQNPPPEPLNVELTATWTLNRNTSVVVYNRVICAITGRTIDYRIKSVSGECVVDEHLGAEPYPPYSAKLEGE